ncbi:MAG: 3-hydroxyacyl-ACP dehydratase FabZ family protein [Balneolaceae bacterium]
MNEPRVIKDLNVVEIQKYQQNRHPILFIDYVDEIVVGKTAEGYKHFTFNEWFFPAHFPDDPNVPGFIQVEALTQMFLMTFLSYDENKGKKTSFISIKDARFKKKVVPGKTLKIKAELDSFRRGMAKGRATGFVDDEIACSIELQVAIPDVLNEFLPQK